METLINMLKINQSQIESSLLYSLETDQKNFSRILRLLEIIKAQSHNMYTIKSIVDSYTLIQVQKHYKNIPHQNNGVF